MRLLMTPSSSRTQTSNELKDMVYIFSKAMVLTQMFYW